jgi:hypothetical protein
MFGIYPQTAFNGPAARNYIFAVSEPLLDGVEINMIGMPEQSGHIILSVRRGIYMDLFPEFLGAEPRFVERTDGDPAEISADQGKSAGRRKSLERQQYPGTGLPLHTVQYLQVLLYRIDIQGITGTNRYFCEN